MVRERDLSSSVDREISPEFEREIVSRRRVNQAEIDDGDTSTSVALVPLIAESKRENAFLLC